MTSEENSTKLELNPRGKTVKTAEMTVRRGLAIIEVFDNAPEGTRDWSELDPKDMRNAADLGDTFIPSMAIWPELWKRYKDKSLHRQVRELAENLDMDSLSKKGRKEIEDGLNRIGSD